MCAKNVSFFYGKKDVSLSIPEKASWRAALNDKGHTPF